MSNRTGNLVKSFFLNRDNEAPRIIDNNDLIEEKLERIRMVMPQFEPEDFGSANDEGYYEDEFRDGIDAEALDALTSDNIEYDEDGNPVSNVIKASTDEYAEGEDEATPPFTPAPPPAPVYDGPSPEEIIAQAEAEAETIKIEARNEIEHMKTIGYEEGKTNGYQEGIKEARAEAVELRTSLEEERRLMEEQYKEKLEELEPKFVHALTRIYEKVFEVDLSGEQSLVLSLLRNTMSKIEGAKNYLIHVSKDDYPYVTERKDDLMGAGISEDASIEIIEDSTLKSGECMIENVNGIFDCSLGTELEALRKRLELLSFTPD